MEQIGHHDNAKVNFEQEKEMKGRKGLNEKFSQPDLLLTCGSWVLGGRWLGERKRRRIKGEDVICF